MRFKVQDWRKPLLLLALPVTVLLLSGVAWAQSGSALPAAGEVNVSAGIGERLTGPISGVIRGAAAVGRSEPSDLDERTLGGFVCLVASILYGVANGYFAELDGRNIASITAANGVIA